MLDGAVVVTALMPELPERPGSSVGALKIIDSPRVRSGSQNTSRNATNISELRCTIKPMKPIDVSANAIATALAEIAPRPHADESRKR